MTTPDDIATDPEVVLDLTSSSFWTSPSSYITIGTLLLPVIALVFHKDTTAAAQAIAQLAPLVAAAVLLAMRGLHKRTLIQARADIVQRKLQIAADKAAHKLTLETELHLAMLQKLPTAAAKAQYVKLTAHIAA